MGRYPNGGKRIKRSPNACMCEISAVVAEEDRVDLPLRTDNGRQLVPKWNATQHDYPQQFCIQQSGERHARAALDALVFCNTANHKMTDACGVGILLPALFEAASKQRLASSLPR